MNEDDLQALEPRAGEELDRTIARYMRVRLDPTAAETRRVRAAVMEAAWRRRLEAPAVAAAAVEGGGRSRERRGLFAAWGGRRVGVALAFALIAGLTVGSSAFAASRAGGPLYDTRLALEELTLPTDPTARLDAELARAQSRVADIVEAASRGDDGAVEAAVRAYGSMLTDLDAEDGSQAGRALDAVRFHQSVLQGLLARVPAQAQGGIEQALARSAASINRLDSVSGGEPAAQPGDAGNPANPPKPGGGNAGGNANGQGNGNAGGNANGQGNGNAGGNANAGATPAPHDNGQGNGGGAGNGGGTGGGKPERSTKPETTHRPPKSHPLKETPTPTD